ncbi:RAI1-domain-containing protein [Hysterangium stoloniferum]|nr:RAI1-domain-containing protein [Hysterangium stoloniferum]
MKYYVPPPPGANLARGYERWVKRPEERGRLDGLLAACVRDECEGERRRADVITWRGVGTKILTAPYEDRDGWDLNVMVVGGTIYLEEHSTDDKLFEKTNISGKQRLMTYYGYAFESYCTSDTPPGLLSSAARPENGWSGDVDTNVQWCSVVKTKLGAFRMIFGGEVDCVRDRNTGQPDTFVELKTSIAIRPGNQNDEIKFEKKLLKFYFQSFLLGVPEIMVGFRTPSGYLQTLQSFKTMDLPRTVRGKPGAWDPATCLTWGESVISFLRHQTRDYDDDERVVWRVTFAPGVGLSMRRLDTEEVADVVAGEERVGFLPRCYWERVRKDSQEVNAKGDTRVPSGHSDTPITGQPLTEKQTLKDWQV